MPTERKYIPALGARWLTPLFDPLFGLMLPESRIKQRLVDQATIQPGHRVLDLGCGTGTLMAMIKQQQPAAHVSGVDPDPDVLAIARSKAQRLGLDLAFDQGYADQLPYPDDSFDRVVSSLVVHHLKTNIKQAAFAEVRRVLSPGGEFHIADFGPPRGVWSHLLYPLALIFEEASDNVKGRLPGWLEQAGFGQVEQTAAYGSLVGTLTLLRAHKPS